jgi:hypothetical protein
VVKIKGKFGKAFVYGAAGVLVFVLLVISGIQYLVDREVDRLCDTAMDRFPAARDKIEASIRFVNSSENDLRTRNRMVWVLGRLGDERALTALLKHVTGKPCNHDKELCQKELKKAILLCGGTESEFVSPTANGLDSGNGKDID